MIRRWSPIVLLGLIAATAAADSPAKEESPPPRVRTALFVVAEGVYNSELMAPWDVLHHSIFRDENDYFRPLLVSSDGQSVTTFEGIVVEVDHSFETAPRPDVLIIPSTVGSLDRDLEDEAYMSFVREAVDRAEWVITVCDGAFPLAATGRLNGRLATTFPGDRAELARRFPKVEVRDDVRLVVDGKFVTSVGGGMSYEPALWLVERIWGAAHARETAAGLVWPWSSSELPSIVVDSSPPSN